MFKTVGTKGDVEYRSTGRLEITLEQCAFYPLEAWDAEVYHRGLKQFTGIERVQFRPAVAQRNHIGLAIYAFVRLEVYRLRAGVSWFETKASIIREAICAYLAHPFVTLEATA